MPATSRRANQGAMLVGYRAGVAARGWRVAVGDVCLMAQLAGMAGNATNYGKTALAPAERGRELDAPGFSGPDSLRSSVGREVETPPFSGWTTADEMATATAHLRSLNLAQRDLSRFMPTSSCFVLKNVDARCLPPRITQPARLYAARLGPGTSPASATVSAAHSRDGRRPSPKILAPPLPTASTRHAPHHGRRRHHLVQTAQTARPQPQGQVEGRAPQPGRHYGAAAGHRRVALVVQALAQQRQRPLGCPPVLIAHYTGSSHAQR